jgi:hypothetical protein
MPEKFDALGTLIASADINTESAQAKETIDQAIRASLLCTLFGVERESWVWPFASPEQPGAAASQAPAGMLAGMFEPLGGIGRLGTLAGASDLDPMDPGPSHTVLPATLAACIAHGLLTQPDTSAVERDRAVASAVLAGIEVAWRFRTALTGTRPGVGFHSPGTFGALAAAGSGARMLGLSPEACVNALAIALTRASGLGINSAASMIGMTHFGWGAFHGLEAALLASQNWDASRDFQRGLTTLFGEGNVASDKLCESGAKAAEALVFKRYPCNIYLNLVAELLEGAKDRGVDRIEIVLPWVPHLDCAQPRDLRAARNSAQAVAAIAGASELSYAAFSGPPGPWVPLAGVARLLPHVELKMDKNAPTGLHKAVVGVRAWKGDSLIVDSERAMRDSRGWGVEHARRLIGPDDFAGGGLQALYGGGYLQGFDYVKERQHAVAAHRLAVPH